MKPTRKKLRRDVARLEQALEQSRGNYQHYYRQTETLRSVEVELREQIALLKAAAVEQVLIRDWCRERAMEHVATIAAANIIVLDVIALAHQIEDYLRGDSSPTPPTPTT